MVWLGRRTAAGVRRPSGARGGQVITQASDWSTASYNTRFSLARAACAGGHVTILELLGQCGAEVTLGAEDNLVEAARAGNYVL